MYTIDKNALIVLSLLKQYDIKKIVVSPGTTNVPIALSVQADPYFEVYSVVDERSAAYFAAGLAFESGEPVVISCTGATASRNYLSGLTEAFYRNLPIIALTSQHYSNDPGNFIPQWTNRSVSQEDVKRISVNLPVISNKSDESAGILAVNKALTLATKKGRGPVHINICLESVLHFSTPKLPEIPKINYIQSEDLLLDEQVNLITNYLSDKKIGVLIGSHRKFSQAEKDAIDKFTDVYNAAVYCDNTSCYHGKYRVQISVAADLKQVSLLPDIIIDIGGVIGNPLTQDLLTGPEFWRISEDGVYHQRFGNLRYQFDCSELLFFKMAANGITGASDHSFYRELSEIIGDVIIPDLPLSNTFISYLLSGKLPKGCSFHFGVSNTKRNISFFPIDDSIDCSCNVGGSGIDGAISTTIGQSMANPGRLYFSQMGDLSFFYDMNALGLRQISNNIRLLLVNNGCGVEFRLNARINTPYGDRLNQFVAAGGHYGSAEAWTRAMGFEYLSAKNRDEFVRQIDDFCSPDLNAFNKPVLFEVFTTVEDEREGLRLLREANRPQSKMLIDNSKKILKQILPKKTVTTISRYRKRMKNSLTDK